jgi:hypothetical protein
MVGITFAVENLSRGLIDATDKTTADGTITADGCYLFGNFNAIHLVQIFRVYFGWIDVEP